MISNKSTTIAHKAPKFLFLSNFFQFLTPREVPSSQTLPTVAMLVTKFHPLTLLCVLPP